MIKDAVAVEKTQEVRVATIFLHHYKIIPYVSIYQSNQYLFSRALIGSHNSQYPRLLVNFEEEVKMTGSPRAKNREKAYIVLFL